MLIFIRTLTTPISPSTFSVEAKPIHFPCVKLLLPVISFIVLFIAGMDAQGQAVARVPRDKAPQKVIKLQFYVAVKDQAMLEDRAALIERVTVANGVYAKTRLCFEVGEVLPLPAEFQGLVTRDDRNALAEKAPPSDKMIQIFLVHSARDVDKLDGWIAGVHWRYSGKQKAQAGRRFIILSAMHSNGETLAHELGHWFGLKHEKDEKNLMCGSGSRSGVVLSEQQIGTLHSHLEAAMARREIEAR